MLLAGVRPDFRLGSVSGLNDYPSAPGALNFERWELLFGETKAARLRSCKIGEVK